MNDAEHLHLQNLHIEGFRGIDALSIPRLGRVTLLAGKNSVGKTTVLDAVRVYAARGRHMALRNLLSRREEMSIAIDEDGDSILVPDWRGLFYGREASNGLGLSIGPSNVAERLDIEPAILSDEEVDSLAPIDSSDDGPIWALKVVYGGTDYVLPWIISPNGAASNLVPGTRRIRRALRDAELPHAIDCESLGPGVLTNQKLARLWDGVALTDDEERAVRALGLIFGDDVERVAVVGDDVERVSAFGDYKRFPRRRGRRLVVRLKGQNSPVPLRSLGDGALRLFGVALALANSQDGFLFIDEAENSIHHSIQRDYWRMVLQAAHENNVQVFATTHSSDCIKGFAQAAREFEEAEGVLVRLSRRDGTLRAVEYPEEELAIAAEQGIEVR